jgi:hypothetical protein
MRNNNTHITLKGVFNTGRLNNQRETPTIVESDVALGSIAIVFGPFQLGSEVTRLRTRAPFIQSTAIPLACRRLDFISLVELLLQIGNLSIEHGNRLNILLVPRLQLANFPLDAEPVLSNKETVAGDRIVGHPNPHQLRRTTLVQSAEPVCDNCHSIQSFHLTQSGVNQNLDECCDGWRHTGRFLEVGSELGLGGI